MKLKSKKLFAISLASLGVAGAIGGGAFALSNNTNTSTTSFNTSLNSEINTNEFTSLGDAVETKVNESQPIEFMNMTQLKNYKKVGETYPQFKMKNHAIYDGIESGYIFSAMGQNPDLLVNAGWNGYKNVFKAEEGQKITDATSKYNVYQALKSTYGFMSFGDLGKMQGYFLDNIAENFQKNAAFIDVTIFKVNQYATADKITFKFSPNDNIGIKHTWSDGSTDDIYITIEFNNVGWFAN